MNEHPLGHTYHTGRDRVADHSPSPCYGQRVGTQSEMTSEHMSCHLDGVHMNSESGVLVV